LEKGFVWGKNKLFFYAINYSIFFPYLCHKFIVMKKTFLLLSLATTLLVACNKPDNPIPNGGMPLPTHIDPSYKVGDYFHNDTLEGVVFYTYNDYNGLMVSLEETKLPWCDSAHILSETGATNPYDGWNNTNIVTANYDLYYFPTISWSYRKNTWHHVHYPHKLICSRQWYVPSSTEMRYLLMNQVAVNATLDSLGYPTLEDKTYWSSTETGTRGAASVRMQNGQIVIGDSLKTLELYVRAIRTY
jgi:hypothetical protein